MEWQPAMPSRRAVLASLGALAAVAAVPPSMALESLIVDKKASARDTAVRSAASLSDALEDLPKNAKKAHMHTLYFMMRDSARIVDLDISIYVYMPKT